MASWSGRGLAGVTATIVFLAAACGGSIARIEGDSVDGGTSSSTRSPAPPPRSPAPPEAASSAATCTEAAPLETAARMCARSVSVASFDVNRASCYVDTEIAHGEAGTLTVPCEGDGEATLTIGSMTFRGLVVGGQIDVCAGTEFPWNDGCTWTSAQRVSGSIADGMLVFAYGEAPKAGETGCASACTASGSIRVW